MSDLDDELTGFGVLLPPLAVCDCPPSTATTVRPGSSELMTGRSTITGGDRGDELPFPLDVGVGAMRGINDGRAVTFPLPACVSYRKQFQKRQPTSCINTFKDEKL